MIECPMLVYPCGIDPDRPVPTNFPIIHARIVLVRTPQIQITHLHGDCTTFPTRSHLADISPRKPPCTRMDDLPRGFRIQRYVKTPAGASHTGSARAYALGYFTTFARHRIVLAKSSSGSLVHILAQYCAGATLGPRL